MNLKAVNNSFEVVDGKFANTCFEMNNSIFDGDDLIIDVFFHIRFVDGKPTDFNQDEINEFNAELGIVINEAIRYLVENNE